MSASALQQPNSRIGPKTKLDNNVNVYSLPDILAISSQEVVLPTLAMNSSELNDLSLSGIINTIISPGGGGTVTVDPNTIQVLHSCIARPWTSLHYLHNDVVSF